MLSFILSKLKPKPLTPDESMNLAVSRMENDIYLNRLRREDAISSFRRTANELASINEELESRSTFYTSLLDAIEHQKVTTEQMKVDNEAVRAKILEIIGE